MKISGYVATSFLITAGPYYIGYISDWFGVFLTWLDTPTRCMEDQFLNTTTMPTTTLLPTATDQAF